MKKDFYLELVDHQPSPTRKYLKKFLAFYAQIQLHI